ncbi:unnamed protein product [Lactuca saligna]|uniref:C2 NT-type domain-containing protein n=1 Tax=Lactuca saligna TaxID=75948 RepID=A0AA36A1L5_LACSI|nr:unnamed protein product [Lactuca saligna]
MSRVTKWKVEKAKVKVVFRLQFHATQIPQSGWEKLFISFIPTETGKVIAKTSKANVKNGSCKWADPIYETTRLLIDSKSKQYDDKLYKLVVGMGTSRSSILGEATINLADYADASQPSVINLPLHGSDLGTILHVTVQLLTAKTGFREFEQQRDKGLQRENESSTAKSPSSDSLILDDQLNKVKTQRQVRPHSKDLVDETGIHEEYSDSQVTCDDSSNTSENYKYDPSITHEVDSIKNRVTKSEKRNGSDELAIAYEENQRLRGSLEVAESSISELKMEVNTLQNHANEMCKETQNLQQELAIEVASSQELMKEVKDLKSECSRFRNDLQQLKEMKLEKIPSLPLQEPRSTERIDSTTEGQNLELLNELKIAKAESESLVRKMEQMECYYEALVQDLEENQKKILGEFQSLKNEHSTCAYSINDQMLRFNEERRELSSINKELQKRATTSESALKRARLNYSIAVSQLQKDLDMLSFQVLSMFETNQTVIKEAFSDSSQGHEDSVDDDHRSKNLSGGGDVLSGDLKKSLSLQENIYKKVEEELGEMCSTNLYLDMYSGALSETLMEAVSHIRKTKEKLQELGHELEVSNESRDVLFMRLQTAIEDVHAVNAQNAYYLSKCNDLQLQNQMLETDLGNVSRENFLLMEKITECEALVMEYRVYKSKHEAVSAEKLEVESLLKVQVFDNQKLQKDLASVKEELEAFRSQIRNLEKEKDVARSEVDDVKRRFKNGLHEMVMKLGNPNESLEKIQFQLESVSNKLKNSLESGERHLENSEVILKYLLSLELEVERMSSEDRNFVDQVKGLEAIVEEFEKSKLILSELKQENQDFVSEINRMKESLRFVNDELGVEKDIKGKLEGIVSCLTLELESQRSEVDHVRKLSSDQESEKSRVVQLPEQHETQMHKSMICEDLKLTFVKSQYESKIEELVKKNLEEEAKLNDLITSEARYIKENEKLLTTIESLRLESNNSIKEWKGKVGILEKEVEQLKELQVKLHDAEARLNEHVEENELLSRTLKSLRLELKASIANNNEISESKRMLEMSLMEVNNEQLKQLQVKLHEMEARLNEVVESEACYITENKKLSTTLESLHLELKDSIAHNAEISEANNKYALEIGQLKGILVKSEVEIEQNRELQVKLHDTEARLNECLEKEACYIKENNNLEKDLESFRLKLEASILQNAEISEANKDHVLEISQLKDNLVKSEVEIGELQMKLHDTEARLNNCLEKEAHYIKENEKLSRTLESVRLELEASIAQNAKISEANTDHALEIGQLKDMLVKSESEIGQIHELQMKLQDTEARFSNSMENEAHYIKETKNLATKLESCRLELQESIAHNEEISKSNNIKVKMLEASLIEVKHELETELLDAKERLDQIVESEAFYVEENESLRSELDAIKKKITFLENKKVVESTDDVFFMREESEIVLMVLKAKLDEQNDELIMIQDKCNELTHKLSEQILKTEEFKNLSVYLKEMKEKSEKKEPEGPTESLRMAFIKEQHQAKLQELKQQLSVSKRHGEEMLFKLQDALDEIESRKKSEALQLKRIQELEAEVESVISDKPDHDRIQAELECAILSLECCKEEKEKLVALLQESEEEKSRISVEVSLMKEQIAQKDENGHTCVNGESKQRSIHGEDEDEDEENSLSNDSKQLMVVNDQFRAQHLKSCMEQLDEELEKMKNDNSILPLTNYDPGFQDLQKELSQLQKANEELGSIYPNFISFPGNGNALQRVLALEIELAEALRTKKKSNIQFQSSFLKQHSDEEAVLKSFRDINELIKDMLEIKGKYVNVESELKEMHERYSELSLQLAEVEGERQKLMMTLKNVRSSRNLLRTNRSSMAVNVIEDRKISENDALL